MSENIDTNPERLASHLIAILTDIEGHLRVIARAHQPITVDRTEFRNPKKES